MIFSLCLLTAAGVSGSVTRGTMCEAGIALPFSRRAGWIMVGLKCGGLSCRKLSATFCCLISLKRKIFNEMSSR